VIDIQEVLLALCSYEQGVIEYEVELQHCVVSDESILLVTDLDENKENV